MSSTESSQDTLSTSGYSLAEQLAVCQQVARLVQAKLPLTEKLSKAARESSAGAAATAAAVEQDLAEGKTLASAIAGDSSPRSRVLAACIQAGESTGNLDLALRAWASMHISNQRAARTVRTALLYPSLLILVTLVSLTYVVWTLIPQYRETYALFGQELPGWLSTIVWCREHLGLLLLALFAGTAIIALIRWWPRRLPEGKQRSRDRCWRQQALASDMTAMMLEAQKPLKEIASLAVAAAGGQPKDVELAFHAIQSQENATPLNRESSMLLSALHADVMDASDVVQNLKEVAEHYRNKADLYSTRKARWIPMYVALVVGAGTVLTYLLLVYLPWIWLLRKIVDPRMLPGL